MTAGFVRAARASDAPGLARIQVDSWRASLAGIVPPGVLDELSGPEAVSRFAARWRDAITSPPTGKHRVHVAYTSADAVGFASAGPATDEDKWPGTDAELYELHVLPPADGSALADAAGHGARLLHAVADALAEDGFRTACTWALSGDTPRLEFLESAGWSPDGARTSLDMGAKVPAIRLHTRLG